MKKYILFITLVVMVNIQCVAGAEPLSSTATQPEATKEPLKIALITIGQNHRDNPRRDFGDAAKGYIENSPLEIAKRIVPHYDLPAVMILNPTTLVNPDSLRSLAGKLGVDRIIVLDARYSPLVKQGDGKGAYVGEYRVYVMEKNGEIIADKVRKIFVIRDIDSEIIKTPPDVIRMILPKNDPKKWYDNVVAGMNAMFGEYL